MNNSRGKYIIKNLNVVKDYSYDNKDNFLSIYEVGRLYKGCFIFFEEHYNRLLNSAKLSKKEIWITKNEIKNSIEKLISINEFNKGNIKICFNFYDNKKEFLCFFVNHYYPTVLEYKYGVETLLMFAERPNPEAKVLIKPLRERADSLIKDKGIYETILVDTKGNITEGSRSNIFFIKNNTLYTSPANKVLSGTVRNRILAICKTNAIKFEEKEIFFQDIENYDAAFISGTSPKILPICKIENINFDVNNVLLRNLMNLYSNLENL